MQMRAYAATCRLTVTRENSRESRRLSRCDEPRSMHLWHRCKEIRQSRPPPPPPAVRSRGPERRADRQAAARAIQPQLRDRYRSPRRSPPASTIPTIGAREIHHETPTAPCPATCRDRLPKPGKRPTLPTPPVPLPDRTQTYPRDRGQSSEAVSQPRSSGLRSEP